MNYNLPPIYEEFCALIKTRLGITANVNTNEGNWMGSKTYSDRLSTNCWYLRIFFIKIFQFAHDD